jgi:hypothetical protein
MHSSAQPERRQPWLKFFPTDWRSDPKLRACSLAARGLWIETIGLMHEAIPYGHLLINGQPPTQVELALQVGAPPKEVKAALSELCAHDVYSQTADGVIFSRRMTRAARRSEIYSANGKHGGNPALLDKQNNQDRLTKIEGKPDALLDKTQIPDARCQIPQPLSGLSEPELPEDSIASEFLERYPEVFASCRSGAVYRTTHRTFERDMGYAREVARSWPNIDRLLSMLELFLRRTDVGPKNVPGTPGQFAHLAPDCDRLLREHGR